MNNPSFKQEQYESYYQQFSEGGIPVSIAKDAAFVLANDQPSEPNLGRTEEDQKKVRDAYIWHEAKQQGGSDE